MYCEFCGKELKENEICDCQMKEKVNTENNSSKIIAQEREVTSIGKKSGASKKLIGFMAAGILCVLAFIIFFMTRPEKIKLADFIVKTPVIKGVNGRGSLEKKSVFDYTTFAEQLVSDKEKKRVNGLEDLDENMSDEEFVSMLTESFEELDLDETEAAKIQDNIEISFKINGKKTDKTKALSNGDILEIIVSSKQSVNKHYHKKFISGSYKYKVSGLIEGQEVSVFDKSMTEVTFQGVDGDGTIEIKSEGEIFDFVSIEEEKVRSDYSNGDKVTLKAIYNEQKLAEAGYYLKEEKKEYTVKGLSTYVESSEEIPQKEFERLKQMSLEKMKERIENAFWGPSGEIHYLESGFMVLKSSTEKNRNMDDNYLVVIGKYTTRDDEELYCYCGFAGVSLNGEQELLSYGNEIDSAELTSLSLDWEELNETIFENENYKYMKIE